MNTRSRIAIAVLLAVCWLVPATAQEALNGHAIRLDPAGKLLPWVTPDDKAYDRVIRLAWDFLLNKVPTESNGLKSYAAHVETLGQFVLFRQPVSGGGKLVGDHSLQFQHRLLTEPAAPKTTLREERHGMACYHFKTTIEPKI